MLPALTPAHALPCNPSWGENETNQTEVLLGVNKEDNNQSIMEAALDLASKEMGTIVALRDQQLKVLYTKGLRTAGLAPVLANPLLPPIGLRNLGITT